MQTIQFATDGGPVVVEVTCGHAQEGSYKLRLWEAGKNVIVKEYPGNFLNPDDDSYELPTPNQVNDGRIVECMTTVVITPPIKKYAVSLTLSQDGKQLGVVKAAGETDQPSETVDLFAQLVVET
ncbi:MAG TPA: hypothetical protein VIV88_00600 [Gemmatimonadales bacterium]